MINLDGSYHVAIDDRGRVRLPSRLLDVLGDEMNKSFFVNRGIGVENNLRLTPRPLWDEEVSQLRKNMNPYDRRDVDALRFFFNGAEEVEVDKVERIRIPKMLLDHIGVEGKDQIVINTFMHFIEIWKADEYQKFIQIEKHDTDRTYSDDLRRLTAKELDEGKEG